MKREIIILGDTELGIGNINDDFISDRALSNLIKSISNRKHAVDLVFNGDAFDFLKAPIIRKGKEYHLRHITPEHSIEKLENMEKAHQKVFLSLKKFLTSKKNRIFFIIGNHDPDLYFPEVQEKLKSILGGKVEFGLQYKYKTVHAEHGNEFDTLNRVGDRQMITNYKGKKILNFPWVSLGTIKLQKIKRKHPFMERITPWHEMLAQHKRLRRKLSRNSFLFTLQSLILYPLYAIDPTRGVQLSLLKEAFSRFKTADYEIRSVLKHFREQLVMPKTKVHVLGHVHRKIIQKEDDMVFINPGTWRDEYTLLPDGTIKSKEKNYVKIILEGDSTKWELCTWPIQRSIWKFDEVAMDEKGFLTLAKIEEA